MKKRAILLFAVAMMFTALYTAHAAELPKTLPIPAEQTAVAPENPADTAAAPDQAVIAAETAPEAPAAEEAAPEAPAAEEAAPEAPDAAEAPAEAPAAEEIIPQEVVIAEEPVPAAAAPATITLTARVMRGSEVAYEVTCALKPMNAGDTLHLGAYVWTTLPGVVLQGEAGDVTLQAGENDFVLTYNLLDGWDLL